MQTMYDAAGKVYRFMMHSTPGEWGGHPWQNWAMNIQDWDWNPGVGIIAAMEYCKVTGNVEVEHDIIGWVKTNKDTAGSRKVINAVAPYAVYPDLYQKTREEHYLQDAVSVADWILYEAPYTREGALEHTVTEEASFKEQVWADTVFMAVLFLARVGRLTNEKRYKHAALTQLELHLRLLQDKKTGLLFHGWNCEGRSHMSAARWARANAWIAMAVPMILNERQGDEDEYLVSSVTSRYITLMRAIVRYQDNNGLWPTVLDRSGYYHETSGSAGIACGLLKGIRMGMLDRSVMPHVERTLSGLLPLIKENGEVTGVSGGTPVLDTVEKYNEVPLFPTIYGQGLVLMLLGEWINTPPLVEASTGD